VLKWLNSTHSHQLGLGQFGFFFKLGSIRFGFQSQVPGFSFFGSSFRTSLQCIMKVHTVCKTSKGSEAVEAFTPSTSCMHDQQLLRTCILARADFSRCKR